jgi:hypothetical protein
MQKLDDGVILVILMVREAKCDLTMLIFLYPSDHSMMLELPEI